MRDITKALARAFKALINTKMFLVLFGPPLLTFLALLVLYMVFWGQMVQGLNQFLVQFTGYTWVVEMTGLVNLGLWLSWIFLVLMFLPLAYVMSVTITAIFALPLVILFVSQKYSLEKRKGGSNIGSLFNVLKAGIVFLFLLVITLPLWLVPGLQVVVPVYLTARFNRSVFMYDVLQDYATAEERKQILSSNSAELLGLGTILGLMNYIPFAFFILPVYSALAFTFYGFETLSVVRQQSKV